MSDHVDAQVAPDTQSPTATRFGALGLYFLPLQFSAAGEVVEVMRRILEICSDEVDTDLFNGPVTASVRVLEDALRTDEVVQVFQRFRGLNRLCLLLFVISRVQFCGSIFIGCGFEGTGWKAASLWLTVALDAAVVLS